MLKEPSSANLMPRTHHDGQEEVLELISEAQGIGAEQGEVTFHQLGYGTGQENEKKKKKKVTWGSQRPLLAPHSILPAPQLQHSPDLL